MAPYDYRKAEFNKISALLTLYPSKERCRHPTRDSGLSVCFILRKNCYLFKALSAFSVSSMIPRAMVTSSACFLAVLRFTVKIAARRVFMLSIMAAASGDSLARALRMLIFSYSSMPSRRRSKRMEERLPGYTRKQSPDGQLPKSVLCIGLAFQEL